MIQVVIDTNVLATAALARGTAPDRVVRAWQARRYTLAISTTIVAELQAVLHTRYFRERISPWQADAFIQLLKTRAQIVPVDPQITGETPHPHDDAILATAVSAVADYLVTGDRELRRMGSFRGVRIVTPLEFLELLVAELLRDDPQESSSP